MNKLGKTGETIASEYLTKNGYIIREKNYRNFLGEIDIIVEYKNEIIFIEVKTRKSNQYGYPEETVNLAKQKKIIKTASGYITRKKLKENNFRFDAILIYFSKNNNIEEIRHIENAFHINHSNNPFNSQQI
jgi:putative endonuclease